jgi:hypothetical protein
VFSVFEVGIHVCEGECSSQHPFEDITEFTFAHMHILYYIPELTLTWPRYPIHGSISRGLCLYTESSLWSTPSGPAADMGRAIKIQYTQVEYSNG